VIAFPAHVDESLLYQFGIHLLWLLVTLAAWVVLVIFGEFWHPLHASAAATCLLAMSVGCFANAFKNRTYHCMVTGPLFLIAELCPFCRT
jgi:hypothetical protein